MNNIPSASIAAAQAILCFPRSRWRRKGAGTSPWQRSSSGQAGGGDGMVGRDAVWGVRGRRGLEPRGEVAEPSFMARVVLVPLPATSLGRTRGNLGGPTGRVLISHIPFSGAG